VGLKPFIVLFSVVGTLMAFAAGVSPEEAVSNVEAWAQLIFGSTVLPSWVSSEYIDLIVFIIGDLFLITALILFLINLISKRKQICTLTRLDSEKEQNTDKENIPQIKLSLSGDRCFGSTSIDADSYGMNIGFSDYKDNNSPEISFHTGGSYYLEYYQEHANNMCEFKLINHSNEPVFNFRAPVAIHYFENKTYPSGFLDKPDISVDAEIIFVGKRLDANSEVPFFICNTSRYIVVVQFKGYVIGHLSHDNKVDIPYISEMLGSKLTQKMPASDQSENDWISERSKQ
jgi:hypothetical protein